MNGPGKACVCPRCVCVSRAVPVRACRSVSPVLAFRNTLLSIALYSLSLSRPFHFPTQRGALPRRAWEAPLDEGSNCAWVHMTTKGQPSGAQGANVVGAERQRLRWHSRVLNELDAWWQCAVRSLQRRLPGRTNIDRQEYCNVQLLLYRCLVDMDEDDYDELEAIQTAEDSWAQGSSDGQFMEKKPFQNVLFDCCGSYCAGRDPQEYAVWLHVVLDRALVGNPLFPVATPVLSRGRNREGGPSTVLSGGEGSTTLIRFTPIIPKKTRAPSPPLQPQPRAAATAIQSCWHDGRHTRPTTASGGRGLCNEPSCAIAPAAVHAEISPPPFDSLRLANRPQAVLPRDEKRSRARRPPAMLLSYTHGSEHGSSPLLKHTNQPPAPRQPLNLLNSSAGISRSAARGQAPSHGQGARPFTPQFTRPFIEARPTSAFSQRQRSEPMLILSPQSWTLPPPERHQRSSPVTLESFLLANPLLQLVQSVEQAGLAIAGPQSSSPAADEIAAEPSGPWWDRRPQSAAVSKLILHEISVTEHFRRSVPLERQAAVNLEYRFGVL